MSDVNDLVARIDGAIDSVQEKIKAQQQQGLKDYQQRQKLFKDYEKVQARIVEIAKPRLEALAKRAGERVSVAPLVSESRRAAKLEFRSLKAYITLTFSVTPDRTLTNAVVERDLRIVPVLWKFDSHTEFSSPIAAFDEAGLTKWLDDQLISFVELYIQIHERDRREGGVRRGSRREGLVPEVRGRGHARPRRANLLLHRRDHKGRVREAERDLREVNCPRRNTRTHR